jgi:hypothetical protein
VGTTVKPQYGYIDTGTRLKRESSSGFNASWKSNLARNFYMRMARCSQIYIYIYIYKEKENW